MTNYNIGFIVGSLSFQSINRTLSQALIKPAPDNLQGTEISIKDLPLYNYDFDASYPPEGTAFKTAVEASDG